MKKLLFGILLAGLAVSCVETSVIRGSGKAANGEFDISTNYTELSVSSGITVVLVESESPVGTITADEEVMDYVSITENNGKVRVKYDPQITMRSRVETVVTIPLSRSISALGASSAAVLKSDARIAARQLSLDSSSAAKVTLDIEVGELAVDMGSAAECNLTGVCGLCKISGGSAAKFSGTLAVRECYVDLGSAAKCNIEGTADYCRAQASSAADFNGYDFVCKKADTDAGSAGSIKITVTEELGANVSSGASVKYKGEPRLTAHDVSSGGSLRKAD